MMRPLCLLLPMAFLLPQLPADPPDRNGWQLVFEDRFDGGEEALDANWSFQNGPSGHILSSRWRDNATVEDGLLRLVARKETRAGQDWTAASCWTKRQFQYGYFECRYRYAAATGTNNSFWLMPLGKVDLRFEIDINEGHYPNEVNMNLHNHTGKHWAKGGRWYYGPPPAEPTAADAGFQFALAEPITARRIRFVSPEPGPVRVMELRVFPPSTEGYPSIFPNPLEAQPDVPNLALGAKAEASSSLAGGYTPEKAIDGKLTTASRWLSDRGKGPHHLTLDLGESRRIGCLQFVSGWEERGVWQGIVREFQLEYEAEGQWLPIPGADRKAAALPEVDPAHDLSREFHVYGLEWDENELVFYFDGQEIRRQPHTICRGPAPILLSLAIIRWAGPVTDAIHGTSMDVDYVRVWQRQQEAPPPPAH